MQFFAYTFHLFSLFYVCTLFTFLDKITNKVFFQVGHLSIAVSILFASNTPDDVPIQIPWLKLDLLFQFATVILWARKMFDGAMQPRGNADANQV